MNISNKIVQIVTEAVRDTLISLTSDDIDNFNGINGSMLPDETIAPRDYDRETVPASKGMDSATKSDNNLTGSESFHSSLGTTDSSDDDYEYSSAARTSVPSDQSLGDRVVSVAKQYIGAGPNKNYSLYKAILNKYNQHNSALPKNQQHSEAREHLAWCAIFASMCLHEAGVTSLMSRRSVSLMDQAKSLNIWHSFTDKKYIPQPGDVMIYRSSINNSKGHTAIVVSYDEKNRTLTDIDGNWDNRVCKRDIKYTPGKLYQWPVKRKDKYGKRKVVYNLNLQGFINVNALDKKTK